MLHLLAAHEIALEDEAMGICGLADDAFEVAEHTETASRACRGHVEGVRVVYEAK